MPSDIRGSTIHGTLIHAPVLGEVAILEDALVSVAADGNIETVIEKSSPSWNATYRETEAAGNLRQLAEGQYLLPGLVDLHIHAPQWPQLGKALHLPLYDWLQEYTFPLEARYEDLDFARRSYESLVDNLLANGTTTFTEMHRRPPASMPAGHSSSTCPHLATTVIVVYTRRSHPGLFHRARMTC